MVLVERCLVGRLDSTESSLCAPIKLLSYVSIPCAIGLSICSVLVEGLVPLQTLTWQTSSWLAFSCVAALVFNAIAYRVVKMLGAVGAIVACQGAVILLKVVPVALLR